MIKVKGKKKYTSPCAGHEGIRRSEVMLPLFISPAVDGGEYSTSHPAHFTPGKDTGTHRMGEGGAGLVPFLCGEDIYF